MKPIEFLFDEHKKFATELFERGGMDKWEYLELMDYYEREDMVLTFTVSLN